MAAYRESVKTESEPKLQPGGCPMAGLFFGLCIVLLFCCSCRLARSREPGLVAHYTFEEGSGSVLEDHSGLENHGKIIGPGWVRGPRGAALDLDGSDYVDCGDHASLRPTGPLTLAVWFRTISDAQQFLVSYHGWNIYLAPGGVPILETLLSGAWDSLGAMSKVSLDEWAFVAIVYDPDRQVQEIYVNGELSNGKPRTERPWKAGQHFRSKVILGSRGFSGLIGDFRVYLRALPAEEIKALHDRTAMDPDLQAAPYRFVMKPHLLYREKELVVETALRGPRGVAGASATPITEAHSILELRKAGSENILQQQKTGNLAGGKGAEVAFPLAGLDPGEYAVRASAQRPDGGLIAQESAWVTLPERPWWWNTQEGKQGLEDKVFTPWTPLNVQTDPAGSRAVSCWGRTYRFSTGLFPDQITTADRDILAEPIRLIGSIDGREITWTHASLQVKRSTPARVVLSRRATDPSLECTVDTQVDYDGMVRADCRIVPSRAATLEKLAFEIRLKRDHARLQYQCRDALFKAPGTVPDSGIVRPFNQAIWLGDEERGLQWFTDSDQYWHLADEMQAIEIKPDGDQVVLRLNLVTKPLRLDPAKAAALTYVFGLQATPVKPIEKDQWDYRWASAHRYGADYAMLTEKIDGEPVLDCYARLGVRTLLLLNWTDAMSYPLPYRRDKQFRRLIQAIHERGMKAVPYFGAQYSELAPGFDAFKADFLGWSSKTPFSYGSYADNYPGGMPTQSVYGPCVRSDWADLMIAGAARLMDEYDVDGIYFDNMGCVGASGCMNPRHPGCGERLRPDGTATRILSIFEGREFMRRLYHVVRSRKPDGIVDLHDASFVLAPVMSWATGTWDGETILGEDRRGANPTKESFILDYLPLDGFRAQFMGKNWGVPVEFIDYYVPYPYERQFALTLLHDVPIRAHMTTERVKAISPLWQVLDEFGRKEAEWLPYWRNSDYVSVHPANAYVSLYRHPKNGVLVVVSNLGKARAQVTVDFALDKLGLPETSTAINALTGEPIPIEKGRIAVDLDSVDWRLVWVKR